MEEETLRRIIREEVSKLLDERGYQQQIFPLTITQPEYFGPTKKDWMHDVYCEAKNEQG